MPKIYRDEKLQSVYSFKLNGCFTISKLVVLVSSLCSGISNIKNLSQHKVLQLLINLIKKFNIDIIQDKNITIVNGKNINFWQQPNNILNVENNRDILNYLVSLVASRNFKTFFTGNDEFILKNIENFEFFEHNNFIFKDNKNHLPLLVYGGYKLQKNSFKVKNTLEKNSLMLNFLVSPTKNLIINECGVEEEYLEKILNFYGVEFKENQFESRNFLTGERIKCKELNFLVSTNEIFGKDFIVPANMNEAIYTIFACIAVGLEEFYIENVAINEFNGEIINILIENGVVIELKNQKILNGIKTADLSIKQVELKPISLSKNRFSKILELYPFLIMLNVIKRNSLTIQGIKELKINEPQNYNFLIKFLSSIGVFVDEERDLLKLDCKNASPENMNKIELENIDEKLILAIYITAFSLDKEVTFADNIDLNNIFPNMKNIFEIMGLEDKII